MPYPPGLGKDWDYVEENRDFTKTLKIPLSPLPEGALDGVNKLKRSLENRPFNNQTLPLDLNLVNGLFLTKKSVFSPGITIFNNQLIDTNGTFYKGLPEGRDQLLSFFNLEGCGVAGNSDTLYSSVISSMLIDSNKEVFRWPRLGNEYFTGIKNFIGTKRTFHFMFGWELDSLWKTFSIYREQLGTFNGLDYRNTTQILLVNSFDQIRYIERWMERNPLVNVLFVTKQFVDYVEFFMETTLRRTAVYDPSEITHRPYYQTGHYYSVLLSMFMCKDVKLYGMDYYQGSKQHFYDDGGWDLLNERRSYNVAAEIVANKGLLLHNSPPLSKCLSDCSTEPLGGDNGRIQLYGLVNVFRNVPAVPDMVLQPIDPYSNPILTGDRGIKAYKTCAVVGGTPYMSQALVGDEIDGHDAVFRFNSGYAKNKKDLLILGNKTTIVYSQPFILKDYYKVKGSLPFGTESFYVFADTRDAQFAEDLGYKTILLSNGFYRNVDVVFGRYDYLRQWRRSVGFVGVLMALQFCEEVDIYGFSTGIGYVFGHNLQGEMIYFLSHEWPNTKITFRLPRDMVCNIDCWTRKGNSDIFRGVLRV